MNSHNPSLTFALLWTNHEGANAGVKLLEHWGILLFHVFESMPWTLVLYEICWRRDVDEVATRRNVAFFSCEPFDLRKSPGWIGAPNLRKTKHMVKASVL